MHEGVDLCLGLVEHACAGPRQGAVDSFTHGSVNTDLERVTNKGLEPRVPDTSHPAGTPWFSKPSPRPQPFSDTGADGSNIPQATVTQPLAVRLGDRDRRP